MAAKLKIIEDVAGVDQTTVGHIVPTSAAEQDSRAHV
jgi:hypothetical protein